MADETKKSDQTDQSDPSDHPTAKQLAELIAVNREILAFLQAILIPARQA
jgi:hypothetical protein